MHCKAKLLKPQRLIHITPEQESYRCEQTWKLMDKYVYLISFGTEEELKEFVGKPQEFVEHRKKTVVLQCDQVPFYCKVKPSQQLYMDSETRSSGPSVLSLAEKMKSNSGGHSKHSMQHLTDGADAKVPQPLTDGANAKQQQQQVARC